MPKCIDTSVYINRWNKEYKVKQAKPANTALIGMQREALTKKWEKGQKKSKNKDTNIKLKDCSINQKEVVLIKKFLANHFGVF